MGESTSGDRLQEAALGQGTVVGEKFVIKRFLAQGGMGRVYVAEQRPMGRKVALKVMHRELASDERAVRRFFREAVAVSKLQHPNTVTLFDYGESDTGALYIAMEFLDGLSLKEVLAHEPLPGLERTAHIVAQVALSLAEAHRKGVIHRDLKPDNIFLSSVDGRPDFVKVIDFGIAQLLTGQTGSRITQAGFVCGTPEYMSPEQARGDEIDARADLYSLGVILFEMLEGRLPYEAETALGTVIKHQTEPVPRLSAHHPGPLADLVERLMDKDRDLRPGSTEAFIRALQVALPDGVGLPRLEIGVVRTRQGTLVAGHALAEQRGRPLDTSELAETLAKVETTATAAELPLAPTPKTRLWLGVAALVLAFAVGLAVWPSGEPEPPAQLQDRAPLADVTSAESAALAGSGDPLAPESTAPSDSPTALGADSRGEPRLVATPQSVTVLLTTDPPDAMVHLDGTYLGLAPRELTLTPDVDHALVLLRADYNDHHQTLRVGSDEAGHQLGPIALTPTPARIQITTEPAGVEVIEAASGVSWGVTEPGAGLLRQVPRSDEPLVLRLVRSRYRTIEREVVPNQLSQSLHVELRRERSRDGNETQGPVEPGSTEPPNLFGPPVD